MVGSLDKIKPSDYRGLGTSFGRWTRKKKVPAYFWKKFSTVTPDVSVGKLLKKINNELVTAYAKKKKRPAKTFADSRFTPLPEMLRRGMFSCGALAKIYATVLRNFGIPVKMIHGRIRGQRGESRHAWLKIYNPKNKRWIAVDPTQHKRGLKTIPTARQLKIYASWDELEKDYEKDKF